MKDFEYYLKINVLDKKILDILEQLDENFGNINGLNCLDEYKIEDLSFLGYNIGFIKIVPKCRSRVKQYHYSQEVLENFKTKLTKKLENKKIFYLESGVKINNQYTITLNASEQSSLTMKYLYCIFNKNSTIDYYTSSFCKITITAKDFILLYEKIINYIDEISKFMVDKMQKINSANNLVDLFLLDLDNIELNNNIIL